MLPMVKQDPTGSENGVPVFADPTVQVFREGFAALPHHPPSDTEYWTEERVRLFKYVCAALRAEVIQNAPFIVGTIVNLKNKEISQNFSLHHNIARFDDEAHVCEEGMSLFHRHCSIPLVQKVTIGGPSVKALLTTPIILRRIPSGPHLIRLKHCKKSTMPWSMTSTVRTTEAMQVPQARRSPVQRHRCFRSVSSSFGPLSVQDDVRRMRAEGFSRTRMPKLQRQQLYNVLSRDVTWMFPFLYMMSLFDYLRIGLDERYKGAYLIFLLPGPYRLYFARLATKNEDDYTVSVCQIHAMRQSYRRDDYASVHLIVIDEKSMIDLRLLHQVNLWCQQIRSNKRPFEDMCVILTGDFAQLHPVRGKPLHATHDQIPEETVFQTVYRSFDKTTIRTICQSSDIRFQHILNELRDNAVLDRSCGQDASRCISLLPTPEIHDFDELSAFITAQVHQYNVPCLKTGLRINAASLFLRTKCVECCTPPMRLHKFDLVEIVERSSLIFTRNQVGHTLVLPSGYDTSQYHEESMVDRENVRKFLQIMKCNNPKYRNITIDCGYISHLSFRESYVVVDVKSMGRIENPILIPQGTGTTPEGAPTTAAASSTGPTTATADDYVSPNALSVHKSYVIINVKSMNRIKNSVLDDWISTGHGKTFINSRRLSHHLHKRSKLKTHDIWQQAQGQIRGY
ncbi:hypothetical protein KCU65_g304, partial [Aureobasidium melanogenum]